MSRPASSHPTDGELAILTVLWAAGPSSLSAVCQALAAERGAAPSTVATMLKVMADKGLVVRTGAGHTAQWKAKLTHRSAVRNMVGKLVTTLFAGSTERLVTHLVESGQLAATDLAVIQKALTTHKNKPSAGEKS